MILLYLIPLTFMLTDKQRAIIGIILQILTGVILVFDQIASHPRIRKQVTKIIQNSAVFAFLITIMIFPFGISILIGISDVNDDKWSTAGGISLFVVIAYGMFMSSLTLLRRIKWLRRKDYVPVAKDKDKFDISDLSFPNVIILFGISLLLTFLMGYLLQRFYSNGVQLIQFLLLAIFTFYVFMIFPILIISAMYVVGFIFAKGTLYFTKKNLNIWFWIFLFVIWAWGGLLLLMNTF